MYKLRTTEDLLTTQFYYDQNVGRCRGLDLQSHLDQVISPSIVKELQPRDLEKRGRFNLVLHDGSKIFDVDPSRLIVDDYDALKELSKRFKGLHHA